MEKINLGRIEVVSRSKSANPDSGQVASTSRRIKPQIVSLEKAQQLSKFKIVQPMYLPFPGMELDNVQLLETTGVPSVVALKYKKDSTHWMVIRQEPIQRDREMRRIFIPFALREGRINNRPAAFFHHVVPASALPNGQLEIITCLWEHEDVLLELKAPHIFSKEEAIKVAEALR